MCGTGWLEGGYCQGVVGRGGDTGTYGGRTVWGVRTEVMEDGGTDAKGHGLGWLGNGSRICGTEGMSLVVSEGCEEEETRWEEVEVVWKSGDAALERLTLTLFFARSFITSLGRMRFSESRDVMVSTDGGGMSSVLGLFSASGSRMDSWEIVSQNLRDAGLSGSRTRGTDPGSGPQPCPCHICWHPSPNKRGPCLHSSSFVSSPSKNTSFSSAGSASSKPQPSSSWSFTAPGFPSSMTPSVLALEVTVHTHSNKQKNCFIRTVKQNFKSHILHTVQVKFVLICPKICKWSYTQQQTDLQWSNYNEILWCKNSSEETLPSSLSTNKPLPLITVKTLFWKVSFCQLFSAATISILYLNSVLQHLAGFFFIYKKKRR